MKMNKKHIVWFAGLACVILLIVLMLTMCSGYGDHQSDLPQNSQVTEESTSAAEVPQEASEETTEETEETEETTEATEETTAPTTGGNTRPGGTDGYNPGYSGDDELDDEDEEDDQEQSSGPTQEKAPAAGSSASPYVERVVKYPDQIATVQIPTENTVSYHIYGADDGVLTIEDSEAIVIYRDQTYTPDKNGVISIPFVAVNPVQSDVTTAAETDDKTGMQLPQVIRIGTVSAAPKAFLLNFHAPQGDSRNPEVLEAVDSILTMEAKLAAGDQDGYTYSYTADKNCRLHLRVKSATEKVPYDIIVTIGDVQKKLSDLETAVAGTEEIAAAEKTAEEKILTVELAAEETVKIQVIALADGSGQYPALDITVLGQLEAIIGTKQNPAPLVLDEINTAIISAGDEDGFWYTWTAEMDGVFVLTMPEGDWKYQINHETSAVVGEIRYSDAEDVLSIAEVEVKAGDRLSIMVSTYDPEKPDNIPAGEIGVYATFAFKPGTKENPIPLAQENNIVEVKSGTTVYANAVFGGADMTVTGPEGFVLVAGEKEYTSQNGVVRLERIEANGRAPLLLQLTNSGEETVEYHISFEYPLGAYENPEEIREMTAYKAKLSGEQLYYYIWTSDIDGVFTVEMDCEDWTYTVYNLTSGYAEEEQSSSDEEASATSAIEVKMGDQIRVVVGIAGETEKEVTARFDAYDPNYGTEGNPVVLHTVMEHTIPVRSGMTVYANAVFGGADMTVTGPEGFVLVAGEKEYTSQNGVVRLERIEANGRAPLLLQLTNSGEETVEYRILFEYPLGAYENPEEIREMTAYKTKLSGEQLYYYIWTSDIDGVFTVEMDCEDWTYMVYNLTSGYAEEEQSSSDEEASATSAIEVKIGDRIRVVVGIAGETEKEVTARFDAYDPNYGTEENPVVLHTVMEHTIPVRSGMTVYANAVFGGTDMTVTGPEGFVLVAGGERYESINGAVTLENIEASSKSPLLLELTNDSQEKAEYTVFFSYPLGHLMNPHIIEDMSQPYEVLVKGNSVPNSQGYFFSWEAEEDCTFVSSMLSDKWTYQIVNEMTMQALEIQYSDNPESSATTSIQVAAGDVLQINVGANSEADTLVTVVFDAYDSTIGTEDNPVWITDLDTTLTVRPGQTLYCVTRHNGADLIITGDVAVTLNGTGYPLVDGTITIEDVVSDMKQMAQLVFTTSSLAKTDCTVKAVYPQGHSNNPMVLTELGKYSFQVCENGVGYWYIWTAPEDGEFTINMLGDDWIYSNQTQSGDDYHYGATNYSGTVDPASTTIDVQAGDIVTINIGTVSGNVIEVPVEFSFQADSEVPEIQNFEGTHVPEIFELKPEEILEICAMDLSQKYELQASVAGIYRLDESADTLMLLDFTDDTYVNLAELVESTELFVPVETEEGVEYQQCNDLLQAYIDCAWAQEVSEEVTRTLYPLTEDLEFILKTLGQEYGWFDAESDSYLFAVEEPEEEPGEEPDGPIVLEKESLWMFACSYVRFVTEDDDVQTIDSSEVLPESLEEVESSEETEASVETESEENTETT